MLKISTIFANVFQIKHMTPHLFPRCRAKIEET